MKITPGMIGAHVAGLVWSLFMGVTAISIGVGAIYPPMNFVAKPIACPNGDMVFHQETTNPVPGTTYTTATWTCTVNGETQDLDLFTVALPAGLFYGLLLEVVTFVFILRTQVSSSTPYVPRPVVNRPSFNGGASRGATARMRELQSLRDQNLISSEEFETKRAEILKNV